MNPKVTVIIANHNYGKYIADAVNSALRQTYPCQTIVVDDSSNDNSLEIIEKLLPSTSIIKLPIPSGPSVARNVGINQTLNDTDFYMILDADDIMAPNKVERFVRKFMEFPNFGVVYADYDNWNIHTGIVLREYKEPFNLTRLHQECIIHSGAGIRKEALLKIREQNGDFYCRYLRCAEDWDLWLRISQHFLISHIAEPLTIMRVHSNNSTYSVNKDIWNKCWTLVQQRLQQRIHDQSK